MKRNRGGGALIAVVLAVLPCFAVADDITVFAAASLRDALGDVAETFENTTSSDVTLVFAASSTIARQVAQGAPADVVLLADEAWGDWLVNEGALNAVAPFAANRLVLVSGAPMTLATSTDILAALGEERLAMAQVEAVPAGRYGKAAFELLGIWDTLAPQVVQSANVRAALRLVERGEARLGVGYGSDLVALPDLHKVYEFDADAPPVAIYSGGPVNDQGVDFMTYVQSEIGQGILGTWGFLPPPDGL